MSNFIAGKTYKLDQDNLDFLQQVLDAKFSGEEGVFTVASLDRTGNAWTDDITSPQTTDRCLVPQFVALSCTEVVNG